MRNYANRRGSGKVIAVIVILVLLLAGGLYYSIGRQSGPSQSGEDYGTDAVNSRSQMPPASSADDEAIKTFDISSKPFEYSIREIRVKKGDTVRINLTVTQGMHDWVVDEFDARTRQITAGASDSVEFVADKAGAFEYYCSVGNHRQMGMIGRLIVE